MLSKLVKASAIIILFFLCLVFGQTTNNDLKITTKNTFSGQSFESTTYIKGSRERTEQAMPGMNMKTATIEQCDLKRSIQLNDLTKKYFISEQAEVEEGSGASAPTTKAPATQPRSQPDSSRRGGIVTYVMTSTDTGERKQMFGFTARHIKTSVSTESSPDACSTANQKIDIDGWYIDFQFAFSCPTTPVSAPRGRPQARSAGCQDKIRFRTAGNGKRGFPLLETTTIRGLDGETMGSITKEVTELSRANLDQALFDVPAGYTQVQDSNQLYSMADVAGAYGRQSQPMTVQVNPNITQPPGSPTAGIKIGVVGINNKSGQNIATDNFRDHLVSMVGMSGIETVSLDSTSPDDIVKEAKQKNCTYILYTDISTMKPASAAKKMGGMLGRATGIGGIGGGGAGKSEAKVDFKLVQTDTSTSVLQTSASAKEDGDEAVINAALNQEASQVIQAALARKK